MSRVEQVMQARMVVELLKSKHEKDVFVPECKDGPTWSGGHFRLDGWAMARSWSHPCVTGYEIKVSRADFNQDKKWSAYLGLCNQFYFVTPHGLVQPEEVPSPAGLIWVSSTGNRLFTKKKADYREVIIPEEVYRYILMSRSKIVDGGFFHNGPVTREQRMDHVRKILSEKSERQELAHFVKRSIREAVDKVAMENKRLASENEKLTGIKAMLERLGLNAFNWDTERRLNNEVKMRTHGIADGLLSELAQMSRFVENSKRDIEKLKSISNPLPELVTREN